jgi:hypothetical protein
LVSPLIAVIALALVPAQDRVVTGPHVDDVAARASVPRWLLIVAATASLLMIVSMIVSMLRQLG